MSVQMREIEEGLFTEQGLTETQVGKQSEVIQRGQLAGGMLVPYCTTTTEELWAFAAAGARTLEWDSLADESKSFQFRAVCHCSRRCPRCPYSYLNACIPVFAVIWVARIFVHWTVYLVPLYSLTETSPL